MAARLVWRHIAVNQKKLAKEEFSEAFTPNGAIIRAEKSTQLCGQNLPCSYPHKTFYIRSTNLERHVRARKDAYNQRNLSFHPRREHMGRLPVRFRPPNILRPAVQLLRHGLRLLRGEQTKPGGSSGSRCAVSVPDGRNYRRRTIVAEKRAAADLNAV